MDRLIEEGGSTEPAYHPYMNGNFVFKHAITRFQEVIYEALHHNGKEASDIDLLIPHQANLRISQFIQEKMKLRDDQVMNNIMRFGNTTAASIPIAWSEAWEEGRLKEGGSRLPGSFRQWIHLGLCAAVLVNPSGPEQLKYACKRYV